MNLVILALAAWFVITLMVLLKASGQLATMNRLLAKIDSTLKSIESGKN